MRSSRFRRHTLTAATGTVAAFLALGAAHAQQQRVIKLTVSPTGYTQYVASHAQKGAVHLMPANTPAGLAAKRLGRFDMNMGDGGQPFGGSDGNADGGGTRYPGDLQYHGGHVVRSAREYLIYVNMATNSNCNTVATCWGDPQGFLQDLGNSNFIHVVDQYVGAHDGDRYRPAREAIEVTYPATSPYTGTTEYSDLDMQTIVYAVTTALGLPSGYHAIYDVFLPPGQDECAGPGVCYSPDDPASFYFCAYHGTSELPAGPTLYTVEPFQDVGGCSVRPNTPNGAFIDSTNNVLSHETIETITDPNVAGAWPTGWWNELNNGMFGQEIGDECSFLLITPPPPTVPGPNSSVYFDPSNVNLNGNPYAIQPEYSNSAHGCATGPGGGDGWGNG